MKLGKLKFNLFARIFAVIAVSLLIFSCEPTTPALTDQQKLDNFAGTFTLDVDINNVTSDITLPTSGTGGITITWTSNKPTILNNQGKLGEIVSVDTSVILTATLKLNAAEKKLFFTAIVKPPVLTCTAASKYEIANPSFEEGTLCGWTPTGTAFQHQYVLELQNYWAGSYNTDGDYLFTSNDHEIETGTLRSSTFELGGSGWITFKMGAAKNFRQIYISIMEQGTDKELARFGNLMFDDSQYTANMVQYKSNLSEYIGKNLYILVTDNATSDWAWIAMDAFYTYYETTSALPENAVEAENIIPVEINCSEITAPTEFDVINGGFDLPKICGWTVSNNLFDDNSLLTTPINWGGETSNPEGKYYLSNWSAESNTGTITSSIFKLGGSGWITFRMAGAKDPSLIYASVYSEEGVELYRFANSALVAGKEPIFITYKADLSEHLGENLYIRFSDFATSDWGWLAIDSVKTYYPTTSELPEAVIAVDLLNYIPDNALPKNYSFETGDLTGWTATGNAFTHITDVVQEWGGEYFNPNGTYYFNSWKQGDLGGVGEEGTGTLTSSSFVLQGSGYITFMLGGAKNTKTMYISILDNDGKELVRYANTEFDGTPKMFTYVADLRQHLGKTLTIKIVDEQTTDWGIMLFDNFRTYYSTVNMIPEGAKVAINQLANQAPEGALPANHSFETGDFTGWTATGNAFATLTDITQEWFGTYFNQDGTYYFNTWKQGDAGGQGSGGTGTLTSSKFTLQGTGFVSFMLGGAKLKESMYISFYNAANEEIARFGNHKFSDSPAMYTYVADLSKHLGEELYIKIVDNNIVDDWDIMLFDNFMTYYKDMDSLPETYFMAIDMLTPANATIENPSFETGDFTGWTATGDAFTQITDVIQEWFGKYFNQNGKYYFNTWKQGDNDGAGEEGTGTLTSSKFVLQGEGYITYILGGAKHSDQAYISIYKEDGTEIGRYGNQLFDDSPEMYNYKVDLTDYIGETLYIKIVDNATTDWAIMLFDNFVTYHHTGSALLENAVLAENLLNK